MYELKIKYGLKIIFVYIQKLGYGFLSGWLLDSIDVQDQFQIEQLV